jgi:hypothetical protein
MFLCGHLATLILRGGNDEQDYEEADKDRLRITGCTAFTVQYEEEEEENTVRVFLYRKNKIFSSINIYL